MLDLNLGDYQLLLSHFLKVHSIKYFFHTGSLGNVVRTIISVSSPIISSRVSLGFCEKKRWKESEWKHQRYHIRTSHQYIFHILYSASKCISCSTLSFTVFVQRSFQECIYRFQQERRGAKYVASSAPVSLLHPRHWAIQDEVNQLEPHPVSESFFFPATFSHLFRRKGIESNVDVDVDVNVDVVNNVFFCSVRTLPIQGLATKLAILCL